MRRETKIIIFAIITIVLNVLAPFLVVKMVKDYDKNSHIYGSPDMSYYEVSTYVKTSDYVYQENLSNVSFEEDTANSCWVYNYHVSNKDFDSTTNNYAVFINDYICSVSELYAKSLTAVHSFNFLDINQKVLGSASLNIRFEFFSSYTNLVIKLTTTDKGYFNSYLDNPGLILTLSKVDSGLSAVLKDNLTATPGACNVKFSVDNSILANYTVPVGKKLTSLPTTPNVAGYDFDGWTIDGENIINPLTIEINNDTQFLAKLTKRYTVTFNVNGEISTTTVRANDKPIYPSDPTKSNSVFSGWTVNNILIDKSTYIVTSDIEIVAKFDLIFKVTFMVDDQLYDTKQVLKGNKISDFTEPVKENYKVAYWVDNYNQIVYLADYIVTRSVTLTAHWVSTEEFVLNSSLNRFSCFYTNVSSERVEVNNGDVLPLSTQITYCYDDYDISNLDVIGAEIVSRTETPHTFNGYVLDEVVEYNGVTLILNPTASEVQIIPTFDFESVDEGYVRVSFDSTVKLISTTATIKNPYKYGALVPISDIFTFAVPSYRISSFDDIQIVGAEITRQEQIETSLGFNYSISFKPLTNKVFVTITDHWSYNTVTILSDDIEVYAYDNITVSEPPYNLDTFGTDLYKLVSSKYKKINSGDQVKSGIRLYVFYTGSDKYSTQDDFKTSISFTGTCSAGTPSGFSGDYPSLRCYCYSDIQIEYIGESI